MLATKALHKLMVRTQNSNKVVWVRAMLLVFFLNGLSPFGLRILAGWGVADKYTSIYLFYWYLGGFCILGVCAIINRQPLSRLDVAMGLLMSIASIGGQVSMSLALAHGLPGNVVYPVAQSSVFVVAPGGVLIFHERVGLYGKVGIGLGLIAAILLGFS
jgi:drug/metabolite transporter (DMT)-like permease